MVDRMWFEKVRTLLTGRADISGSFAPNSSSALSAASTYGKGFTVAYTSTGLFTITLNDTYVKMISASCALQLATGDDKYLQLGSYSASGKTITIRVWDASGAAVADISANANNRIHFNLIMTVSGVD